MLPTHFCAHFPFRLTYYVISWLCTRDGLWARLNDPSLPANAKSPFVLKDVPELFFFFFPMRLFNFKGPVWKQRLAPSPLQSAEICDSYVSPGVLGDMQGCFHVMFGERPEMLASLPSRLLTRIQSAGEICILNTLIFPGRSGTPADRALASDQSALMDTCWLQWTGPFNGSAAAPPHPCCVSTGLSGRGKCLSEQPDSPHWRKSANVTDGV